MFDNVMSACTAATTTGTPPAGGPAAAAVPTTRSVAAPGTSPADPVRWSEREPDAALVAVLARPPDPPASDAERVERIGAFERAIGWLQTLQDAEMSSFVTDAEGAMAGFLAGRDPADGPAGLFDTVDHASRSATSEIQLMLHLTGAGMLRRLEHARRLHEPVHGPTAALARAGLLPLPKARKILEGTADPTDEQTARLQAVVLPAAPRQTVGQLRAAIDRFLTGLTDRELPVRRQDRAIRSRSVELQAEPQGMATLRVFLPAAAAVGIYAVLDEHARRCGRADPRTMDQRRTDVLADLVLRETRWAGTSTSTGFSTATSTATSTGTGAVTGIAADPSDHDAAATGAAPAAPGPAPAPPGGYDAVRNSVSVRINVTVSLDVLLGRSGEPAELAGYGPLPVSDARALAFDPGSVWYRLLTDPAGRVVHRRSTAYRPGAALTELVRARHGRCAHPGCRVPAHRCDLDHVVPHDPRTGTGRPGWSTVLLPDGSRHPPRCRVRPWSWACPCRSPAYHHGSWRIRSWPRSWPSTSRTTVTGMCPGAGCERRRSVRWTASSPRSR